LEDSPALKYLDINLDTIQRGAKPCKLSIHYSNQKIKKIDDLLNGVDCPKTKLNLITAIDFTYSNGLPDNPVSNHYSGEGKLNCYERAITNIHRALDKYDTDKEYPVYGFGGIPHFMKEKQISHCFPLNGDTKNPYIKGIG